MAMRASAPSRNVGDAQGEPAASPPRTHDEGALNRASRRRTPPGASGAVVHAKRYGSGH